MNLYMLVLRMIHILAGVYWAGSAFLMVGIIQPVVTGAGQEGAKFMQSLGKSRFSASLLVAAGLTVLSGLLMYWRASGGFQVAWLISGMGLGYSLSSLAGLGAFVVGAAVAGPATRRLGAVGREVQAAGMPPTPAQAAEMQAQQKKLADSAAWTAMLLVISVLGMSVAEYLFF